MARSGLNKSQVKQIARQEMQMTAYSGPLPPPEILEHFDKIIPGGAERIFAQFESQSKHRQKIEASVVSSNAFVQIFGAISASLIGLASVVGGLYLVHEGKSLEGFGAFFTTLASLVGVYVYGRKSQAAERKSKQG